MAYLGVEYENEQYNHGKTIETKLQPWLDVKFHLGLDFPNMPYYIDGDVKLSESKSIMKYICKKYQPDLLGRTPFEVATADMVSRVHDDMHKGYA